MRAIVEPSVSKRKYMYVRVMVVVLTFRGTGPILTATQLRSAEDNYAFHGTDQNE